MSCKLLLLLFPAPPPPVPAALLLSSVQEACCVEGALCTRVHGEVSMCLEFWIHTEYLNEHELEPQLECYGSKTLTFFLLPLSRVTISPLVLLGANAATHWWHAVSKVIESLWTCVFQPPLEHCGCEIWPWECTWRAGHPFALHRFMCLCVSVEIPPSRFKSLGNKLNLGISITHFVT